MSGGWGREFGPCVECHMTHTDCTGPTFCCDDCLHLDATWEGYRGEDFAEEPTDPTPTDVRVEPAAELREALARWLFERDYRERGLASPDDAPWHEWSDRNQDEWREEADKLLSLPIVTAHNRGQWDR